MKRISVLFVVLALMLGLLAGCGTNGRYGDGSNVSTTDDGTVNGVNPDGTGIVDGDGIADNGVNGENGSTGTGHGVENAGARTGSR